MRNLEAKATRFLALAALREKAIDPATFDFLDEAPERAEEVPEFTAWLAKDRFFPGRFFEPS